MSVVDLEEVLLVEFPLALEVCFVPLSLVLLYSYHYIRFPVVFVGVLIGNAAVDFHSLNSHSVLLGTLGRYLLFATEREL